MEITFTKEQKEKYNRLWKEDLENKTKTQDEYYDELVNELIKNHTVDEIEDEFQDSFHHLLHYTFKESGETDRLRYKCGVIVQANLSDI
jgi:hypothetical protein